MKTLLSLCTFLMASQSIHVFLVGGALSDNQTDIFQALAKSTDRHPSPNSCGDSWESTQCPRIAVITSAAPNQKTGNQAYSVDADHSLSYQHLFSKYGFFPHHISAHIDNYQTDTNPSTSSGKNNLELLSTCDIIFFNGGDQARHSRTWLMDDGTPNQLFSVLRNRAIQNEVVLAGTSAGTMTMSPETYGSGISFGILYFAASVGLAQKSVEDGGVGGTGLADTRNGTSGLQYEDNAGKMAALNFVDLPVDTHFDARGRLARLIPSLYGLQKSKGIGVDENTCLEYHDGKGKVFGQNGVFIVDISRAIPNPKQYFAVDNVIVDYLTAGDSYLFPQGQVTSSKKLISKPYHSGHYDSSDILRSYETTYVMKRLVDQTGLYNLGTTRIPSGYPNDTPAFEFKFIKGTQTKGYYDGEKKKYTCEKVVVNLRPYYSQRDHLRVQVE